MSESRSFEQNEETCVGCGALTYIWSAPMYDYRLGLAEIRKWYFYGPNQMDGEWEAPRCQTCREGYLTMRKMNGLVNG